MDCSLTVSSVRRILQAIILEWVAMPSSRGSFWPRDPTCISYVHWQVGSLPLSHLGSPDILVQRNCLLRNLYAGQEAIVRTLYGTADWFKIEKGVWQGCLLSPCLFNLYTGHIMRNARLDELQVGIKIGRRNINNLRYADDITLMAESEEELKSLLMRRVKEPA